MQYKPTKVAIKIEVQRAKRVKAIVDSIRDYRAAAKLRVMSKNTIQSPNSMIGRYASAYSVSAREPPPYDFRINL